MFAAIDSLVPLLIFIVIAVLSAILKKRGEPDEDEQHTQLPRMPGRTDEPQRTRKSWEEELRELLQKQLPQEQPAPPPLPRQQAPPPILRPEHRQIPRPQPQPVPRPIEPRIPEALQPQAKPVPGLSESDLRYAHAAALDERVAQHMQDLRTHRVGLTTAERHDFRSTHEAIALVRDPRNLRAAILATVILGPPKALEQAQ